MNIVPRAPFIGDVLDLPINRSITRGYYTSSKKLDTVIQEDKSMEPDVAKEKAKPRLGDNSLVEVLQKVLQTQESETMTKAMPSNLDYRK